MSHTEPEFSLEIPSLFVDGHRPEPSLAYMGASRLLSRAHPGLDMPCSVDSEQLEDGTWVLRNLDHVTLALVNPAGVVSLVAPAPEPAAAFVRKQSVTTHGIEVHEGHAEEPAAPVPYVVPAQVVTETRWSCPSCRTRWRKVGNIVGQRKTCRQCGTASVLGAVS